MSEVYNPEAALYQRIEALEIEARSMKTKRDEATSDADRTVRDRQLREIEKEIERLKRRLKAL
ncbi:MAG: hypothetical protein R3336_02125 [Phycisphaeraceae bacterium]|nr:hypothetical protein [Phycisphaeraceae bacterium]